MPGPNPSLEHAPEQKAAPITDVEQTSVEADRAAYEQSAERRDDVLHAEESPELQALEEAPATTVTAAPSAVAGKDEVVIEVEKILEDGIGPYFSSLPEDARPLFKKKGEEVAGQLSEMVRTFHFNLRRAYQLITDWLKTIPGVNKFFLEQEAKIKTDRILALMEERKKDELP